MVENNTLSMLYVFLPKGPFNIQLLLLLINPIEYLIQENDMDHRILSFYQKKGYLSLSRVIL